ncbi:DUF4177 domain-containing protein [Pararhodobacter sp. SW119]|uniref:DUF4177 domain-containing protein n=1 Tax=Pararhodobacter sp. SW119 TaxID=2780075 RepID=UPI001ADFF335|nr:DUF4177 domain-containing protein [Pararhodobacter sp. SW119]
MFEYKVIPAPARAEKVRGLKSVTERFAHSLTQAINAEAEDGWEYVRAESLPCEERKGIMGGTRRTTETVLIFRRAIDWTEEEDAESDVEAAQPAAGNRREPLFRPDVLSRAAAARRAEPRLRSRDSDR